MRIVSLMSALAFTAMAVLFTAVGASTASRFSSLPGREPFPSSTRAPARRPHLVKIQDGRVLVSVPPPAGCSAKGPGSFVGGGINNIAGGSDAGVLAGDQNNACDSRSAVLAGDANIINGGSTYAAIYAGLFNGTQASVAAMIGGGESNLIGALPLYGNSDYSAIVAGISNTVASPGSFIGSGQANSIIPPSAKLPAGYLPNAFIGAGYGNTIASDYSVIVGGLGNTVTGEFAALLGGYHNSNGAYAAFLGSGQSNSISQNGATGGSLGAADSVIAGGYGNSIVPLVVSGAHYGVIGGGHGNTLSAFNGVIAGGEYNAAKGDFSTVPGGLNNIAGGVASFAAGSGSQALHNGTFVWSDYASPATPLKSSGVNEFLVRASGGVAFYTSASLKSGVALLPGSGSWSSLSDRASKRNIVSIDANAVLAKVEGLPISEWSYRTEDASIRHVGPMAQDFYAAFGIGEDDRHITTIDEDGIALAAIKALARKHDALQADVQLKDAQVADLARSVRRLQKDVAVLMARSR